MERINIVGGLKAEPLEIHYGLSPANETSVEISVDDIYSDSENSEETIGVGIKDSGSGQRDSSMECLIISDVSENEMETSRGRQMFNYIGISKEDKTKKINRQQEKYVFNYTGNHNLLIENDNFMPKIGPEVTHENGNKARSQLHEELFIESTSCNDVHNEINSDSAQNNGSVREIMKHSTTVQNKENRSKNLDEAVLKDKSPECSELTSDNDVHNEINGDSEQNDQSVDTVMNNSTTTVQNNEKRSNGQINLAEAIFKDDLSYREYREAHGYYICKHCHHKGSLQNIKNHIIAKHRKTETKQCPFCNVKTKVLAYHIRVNHKTIHRTPECNDISKKSCNLKIIESTLGNDVNNEINSGSEENDQSTPVQNNEKRSNGQIHLAEAVFKDDLSHREYREAHGRYVCKHCRYKDTLENIKKHIISTHRKTETKQCPFCNVKTKVLAYHIRMNHKSVDMFPECNDISKKSCNLKTIEPTSDNDVNSEINTDSEQNNHSVDTIMDNSTTSVQNNEKISNRQNNLDEAVFKDKTPECNNIPKKSCNLKITESTSDDDVDNEINSDSEQSDDSVDITMNHSTTTVQNSEKRSNKYINLAEAVFNDDLSCREYRKSNGYHMCKHCYHRGTLQNIKNHIIEKHRQTETKQCPFCNVKTKVLAYHIRMSHNNMHRTPECNDIPKKSCNLKIIESTSDNDVNNESNSDSEQSDHSGDTIMNDSTTTLQNSEKRSNKYINLAEAVFNDDLSYREYKKLPGCHMCKHCHHKGTLQNIKKHIIAKHRETERKQCPFCNVKTKVLAYHIRMYHNNMHRTPKCNDIPKKSCNLRIIESTSDNNVNNEINSDSEQNNHSVDTIMNNSTTTVQNNEKISNRQINLDEAVFKDKTPECNDISKKSCNLKIIESTSGNDVPNEINSDSEQNDHSTATVQNNEKRSRQSINLAEAVFKDDFSSNEYRYSHGLYVCKHCRHKDTLQNIKNHIIAKHRKTETKQCPFCDVKTNVLTYHIRVHHNVHRSQESDDTPKKPCNLKIIESISGNDVDKEIKNEIEKNNHSVDSIMPQSTTTAQNNKSKLKILLDEAVFNDDLSYREYKQRYKKDHSKCLHCGYKDTLENIKDHIIAKHRKTKTKQCPSCNVKTKVLAYHTRMHHKDMYRSVLFEHDIPRTSFDNEINSDSEQNNGSVDTIMNNSTTSVQNNEKISNGEITLDEAVFKDDISRIEYKYKGGCCYVCLHCHHEDTVENIKNHIIENHRKTEEKQCYFCNVKTKGLAYHMRIFHKKMFKCPECNFIAKKPYLVKAHIEIKHRVNLTKCDKCGKIFTSKHHLYKHDIRIHRNHRSYYCAHCDFSTNQKEALVYHLQRHRDPQKLPTLLCDKCDYRTKNKYCFSAHKKKHNTTLVCDQCGYSTGVPHVLKLHIISHKKQPDPADLRYHCDKCDYKTHRFYSLKIHKMKHLKPGEIEYFYCYHCNFKANRKDNLKTHIRKLHFKTENKPLQCSICPFTTPKKHLLVQHVDKHPKNLRTGLLKSRSSRRVITNLGTARHSRHPNTNSARVLITDIEQKVV